MQILFNTSAISFIKFIQVLIIFTSLQLQILSVSVAPTSFYDYSPPLMEGDKIIVTKGVTPDNDPTSIYNSTYTVNLLRIKNLNPSSYIVVIGFKHISIDIPNYPPSTYGFTILVQNITAISFSCLSHSTYESAFIKYQVSYMAISKLAGNIYYFGQIYSVNQALIYPAFVSLTFTDSSIKQIGRPYTIIQSMFHFDMGYDGTSGMPFVVPAIYRNTTTFYTINLYTNGVFVYQIGVQGILFDPDMLNNVQRKYIFLYHRYAHSGSIGYVEIIMFSYPGVIMLPTNTFIGLYYFYTTLNKLQHQINLVNNQVKLFKYIPTSSLSVEIIVYFRNDCSAPFSYQETQAICKICMDYCLDCDASQCFTCAVNFTLSADKTQCQCADQIVSQICFSFDQSPMKGCVSAVMDGSRIKCLFCSITLNLIQTNNSCQCKNGYEFDTNKNCVETCGDGKVYQLACDDGNLMIGDGCNDKCMIETGFICDAAEPSLCRLNQYLRFLPLSILKNKNNSAIIKFGTNKQLLFSINFDHLIDANGLNRFNLTLTNNTTQSLTTTLDTQLLSVENNQITMLVNYDHTIECSKTHLFIDLTETKYTPLSTFTDFNICGDNEPLVISEYFEIFSKTEYAYFGLSTLILIMFLIGLFTPKFIGLEAILTLQLIYYSCFLINKVDKIPVGFRTLTVLKSSTGYNDLFSLTIAWGNISNQTSILAYKQINFLYLIIMGISIFILNSITISGFHFSSIIALVVHVIYIISLKIINPYKNYLKIHKYGLFVCQFTYLIFILAINYINFFPKIDEIYSLIFMYGILFACFAIIMLTFIRLYYQCRYGEQFQKKIQKDRQIQKNNKLSKQENQLRRKMKRIQAKISQKINQKDQQRLLNKFFIQNQIKEEQMNDEIQFLDTRPNLTEQKKQFYYMQKFDQKPLSWLKKHNLQEYSKKINQIQQKKAEQKEKKKQRQIDPQYIKLTNKLRKQFCRMNRKSSSFKDNK